MEEKEEEVIPTDIISEAKLKKLKNLKFFRDWSNEQIVEWVKNKKKDEIPPAQPPVDIPGLQTTYDPEEYKRKYNQYLQRYKKEYAVDMNDANDAEAVRSLVRYVLQLEQVDINIMNEQHSKHPQHQVLKGLGDFQRSVQMNIDGLQEKLGITRKARKAAQVDDFPRYVQEIQKKAKEFWNRKTIPVKCEKCHIELARYWLNFADNTKLVRFEIVCEKCKEMVLFSQ